MSSRNYAKVIRHIYIYELFKKRVLLAKQLRFLKPPNKLLLRNSMSGSFPEVSGSSCRKFFRIKNYVFFLDFFRWFRGHFFRMGCRSFVKRKTCFFPFLIFVDSVVCFVVGFQRSVLNRMRGFWVEKPEVNRKFPGSVFSVGRAGGFQKVPQKPKHITEKQKKNKKSKGHAHKLT